MIYKLMLLSLVLQEQKEGTLLKTESCMIMLLKQKVQFMLVTFSKEVMPDTTNLVHAAHASLEHNFLQSHWSEHDLYLT